MNTRSKEISDFESDVDSTIIRIERTHLYSQTYTMQACENIYPVMEKG